MAKKNSWEKLYRGLIYALPAVLFFSYEPVIALGSSESMNFELSLPLIWLVVFGVVAVVMMCKRGVLFKDWRKKWVWLLFPLFLSLSVLWSLNLVRGVLTVGVLWLLYLAIDGMWSLKGLFAGVKSREIFMKVFFGTSLVICGWCILQCILDLTGVAREYTLICAGCTYHMFGFPHPDGFAIEPQFMGNLLIAPAMVAGWILLKNDCKNFRRSLKILLLTVLSITLFLTFSRGAIYAFGVGMVLMSAVMVVQAKKERGLIMRRVGLMWGVVILSFVVALNVQGLMAAVSPTNDTYQSGVAKVLNHLSLGVIDILSESGEQSEEMQAPATEITGESSDGEVVEKPVENSAENEAGEEAVFDGYVAESTDTRLRLTGAAVEVWRQDFATAMFGVGLGGAGQALYVNGLSPAPKEIVQNEYASLLLETGIVGISLLVLTVVLVMRVVMKSLARVMMPSLIVAYGVSLLFFSGLPNALQIYLMPAALLLVMRERSKV